MQLKYKLWFALILLVLCNMLSATTVVDKANATFVATNEWQEILPDQAIPRGLHVRINLTTRKREAKLLEANATHDTALAESSDQVVAQAATTKNLFGEEREILRLIEAYEALNETAKRVDSLKQLASKLDDLNNAHFFLNHNGLDLLKPMLVSDANSQLRLAALRVLGPLLQNNPEAKAGVYEQRLDENLAQLLQTATTDNELAVLVYVLGGLLRQFPAAQATILNDSVVGTFVSLLRQQHTLKVKLKTLALIADLTAERELNLSPATRAKDESIVAQYEALQHSQYFLQHNYCSAAVHFLRQHADKIIANYALENVIDDVSRTKEISGDCWTTLMEAVEVISQKAAHANSCDKANTAECELS